MNHFPQLPKGHTSILSPKFRYVPAVHTDVAETFARVRGQRLQPQPTPMPRRGVAAARLENDIEVFEASWLLRKPPPISTPRRT